MVTNGSSNQATLRRAIALGALLIMASAGCGSKSDAEPDGTEATTTDPAEPTIAVATSSSTTTSVPSTPTIEPTTTTDATTTTDVTTTIEPTTTIDATTTTEPPSTTSTTLPATTTTVASACPQAPPPAADATDATSTGADFDGDGLADVLSTYIVPSEARWHVRVEFGAGGSDDMTIEDSDMATPARPIGGLDVDGDGFDEAFVTVGSGASSVLVGLYDVAACGLTRVTIGTDPAVFPIGATVGNISGLACNVVGDLDRVFAQWVAEDVYEGGFEPFTLSGSVLTPGFGDGAGFSAAEAGALATLNCGTLALPS